MDLREVRAVSHAILQRRKSEIKNGKLDGQHWFVVILEEAIHEIQSRRVAA